MRRLLPVALVVSLALLAAGCGSKSSSEPATTADWANSVCTSITTWKNSVTTAASSLKGGDLSKSALTSAADDAKSATDTLKSDLKDLGKPPLDSGQQAKDLVDQLATELNTDIDSIKQAVDSSSGGLGAVGAAATAATTFSTMQTQLSSTLSSLQALDAKGELTTAFQQSSSCKQLTGSS
jgi:hypothetical protein